MFQRHVGLQQQQQQGRVGLGRVLSLNVCNNNNGAQWKFTIWLLTAVHEGRPPVDLRKQIFLMCAKQPCMEFIEEFAE